ncbi:NPCBM/NEW2 domain-containing protein [Actinophytocola oryzae]|uniref:NPCBM/NEW2 domain-containing protein n=1 Tax=Actinophytocola oryzae TaxID=502181 RepID=A0A4R7W3S6_9PSEU|nr:NPCBM/NEW2 domain-containing protein [Actinophytocola oryzae]
MSGRAFVNFRLGDAENTAELIDQKLCRVLGVDRVFRSSRAMHGGTPFPPTLAAEAAGCAVMLVVVGHHWLTGHRIDDPDDWVRAEIAHALREDRPVIQVLTTGRGPLAAADLPAPIAALADRPHLDFHPGDAGLDRLVREVRRYVAQPSGSLFLTTLPPSARSPGIRLGTTEIDGTLHGDSIVFGPYAGSISFRLAMRYRRLDTIVAALPATSARDVLFTVTGDGRTLAQSSVTPGDPLPLTVDVTDVLTLTLAAHRPDSGQPDLAWASPVVHP